MQGLGALLGSIVLYLSVRLSGSFVQDCKAPGSNVLGYQQPLLVFVWRSVYVVGILLLLFVVVYRFQFTKESSSYLHAQSAKEGSFAKRLKILFTAYGPRLAGTALSWFLWDVCFYGNKLFISSIIEAASSQSKSAVPSSSLAGEEIYILINNAIALIGYLLAALLIDRIGRRSIQLIGFFILSLVFLTVAALYPALQKTSFTVFFVLYLLTSFFGQLGPNATTYLLPAETFPTEVRSIAHGLSAFAGKVRIPGVRGNKFPLSLPRAKRKEIRRYIEWIPSVFPDLSVSPSHTNKCERTISRILFLGVATVWCSGGNDPFWCD